MSNRLLPLCLLLAAPAGLARGVDYITHLQGGKTAELAGRVQIEAEDGGVLLLTPDGTLWPIPKEEIAARRADERPFEPLPRPQLAAQLAKELPAGFKVHHTKHYLICYNTS